MSEHSPEPWREGEDMGFQLRQVLDANGLQVCAAEAGSPDDIHRIIACINACKGIPTEDLEFSYNQQQGQHSWFIQALPKAGKPC